MEKIMHLFEKPRGVETRWFSFENSSGARGLGGLENKGAKGHAFHHIEKGETATLVDVQGSGTITRIWLTINDRSPEMLRGLRMDMCWDGSSRPGVSAPLGDFFGVSLGRRTPFENALFSDPEGRSFNCCIPMPFRTGARITITNESGKTLPHLFYDVDLLLGVTHSAETLYFHACWRRESPNQLGKEFTILPRVAGSGRFLGCNLGIIADEGYKGSWWGEGEVKVRFGDDENPTLCGTGTEDYIGTGWGQGVYGHRTQGCLIADSVNRHWAFYRYHIDDPIYFDDACEVSIQTIGGSGKLHVLEMLRNDMPLIPISVDTGDPGGFIKLMDLPQPVDFADGSIPEKWTNFWRQDDWSATAYFYLDSPHNGLPPISTAAERIAGLSIINSEGTSD
jgi:hypothetical protein